VAEYLKMNTRKILLISEDKDLITIVNTSSLTFTKLNCQISLESISGLEESLERSKSVNLDLIIADNDLKKINMPGLFREIRKSEDSRNKKIICLYSENNSPDFNREEIFNSGCDSVMTKQEFKRVVNNVLVF
jgi:CheY-like chemotaxis protein